MLGKYLKGTGHANPASDVSSDEARELRAAIEERDAAIERLEQTISELTAQTGTLQRSLDDAEFKTGILKQSYSTQLCEARERAEAAEQSITDQQTRIEELEADHKALNRELAGARARLDSIYPDEASIDELLDSFSMRQARTRAPRSDDLVDEPADQELPEEMLAPDVMFAGKRK